MRNLLRQLLVFSLISASWAVAGQESADSLTPTVPEPVPNIVLESLDVSMSPEQDAPGLLIRSPQDGLATIRLNGEVVEILLQNGVGTLPIEPSEAGDLYMIKSGAHEKLVHVSAYPSGGFRFRHIPLWTSILPPLIAIALALIFREVIISLFIGVWTGAFIAGGLRLESMYYFIMSFFSAVTDYVIEALTDSGHLSVILFSLLIGGMVAIISKNGGMAGVVLKFSRYARSSRSSQMVT
jgi:hypothetical protein